MMGSLVKKFSGIGVLFLLVMSSVCAEEFQATLNVSIRKGEVDYPGPDLVVGHRAGSSEAYDSGVDRPYPPTAPNPVSSLAIRNSVVGRMTRDYRSSANAGETWLLEQAIIDDDLITISWDAAVVDDANWDGRLLSITNGTEFWSLQTAGSLTVVSGNTYEIVYGTDAFYTVTFAAGANGSITGETSQTVLYGTSATAVTAVPETGYHFVQWSDANTDNPRTVANVTATATYTAEFAINTYAVTFDLGDYGIRTGGGALVQTVAHGSGAIAPDVSANTGRTFAGWDVTFVAITGDLTVNATYSFWQTAADPVCTPASGASIFKNGLDVTITCSTSDATIWYTTNGAEPVDSEGTGSLLYSVAIHLSETTTIKARSFRAGLLASGTVSSTYTKSASTVVRTIIVNDVIYPQVDLEVAPGAGLEEYLVWETLPAGLVPRTISDSGDWDATTRRITWGPFTDVSVRQLGYSVAGADGTYSLATVQGLGESTLLMSGESKLKVNHKADADGLDDAWEISHFGTLEEDDAGDYDGDGIDNVTEWENGTDPGEMLLLAMGWNLVSAPTGLDAAEATVPCVFEGCAEEGLTYCWDAANASYVEVAETEALSCALGYWVYSAQAAFVSFKAGTNPAPTCPALSSEWNLLSIPQGLAEPTMDAFAGAGVAQCIWSWNSLYQCYEYVESNAELDPAKGYWVYTVE
jgi:hypothetical protein